MWEIEQQYWIRISIETCSLFEKTQTFWHAAYLKKKLRNFEALLEVNGQSKKGFGEKSTTSTLVGKESVVYYFYLVIQD